MTYSDNAQEMGRLVDYFGERGCSDVHLSAPRGVWYVLDKVTLPYDKMPSLPAGVIDELIEEFLPGGRIEFDKTDQGDTSFDVGGRFRGRLAARNTQAGVTITIRIISRAIPTPESLHLPASLIDLVTRPAGLIIFAGQTGSGKSTSIAALVNSVNLHESSSIYTLESPIEYIYPDAKSLVNQRAIGEHVESFAMGVENAKRSHPKLIVIGEIMNASTARAALTAASSGHLVVTTMHAGSTAEAIDGLISMFPPQEQPLFRTQLSQVLLGVVIQLLVPKINGGLALAQEIAFNTRQFAEMILGQGERSGDMKLAQQYLLGTGRREGMVAMETSLAELVIQGEISQLDATHLARDKKVIHDLLNAAGFPALTKE